MSGYEEIESRSHIFIWLIRQALDDIAAHTVWMGVANDECLPSDSNRQRVIRFKNIRNVLLSYSPCQCS